MYKDYSHSYKFAFITPLRILSCLVLQVGAGYNYVNLRPLEARISDVVMEGKKL